MIGRHHEAPFTDARGILVIALLALTGCTIADPVSPGSRNTQGLSSDAFAGPIHGTFKAPTKDKDGRGRLAFAGDEGIYTMRPDGSGLALIAGGFDPSWSPDGLQIAFSGYDGAVYIMSADGSNIRRITSGFFPTWSPDGTRLAYTCGGICTINVDGTDRRVVTFPPVTGAHGEFCIRDTDPSWSPNGTTIAFTRWPDSHIPTSMCLPVFVAMNFAFDFWTEIWFAEADGTNVRPLADAEGIPITYAGWPAWSPNGSQLAFYHANVGRDGIAVVNADGSGFRTVVQRSPVDWYLFMGGPDWSPDGKKIVVGGGKTWGLVDASGSASALPSSPPFPLVSNWATWSWSRR